jgi:excisionase family DNA binding protein
MVPILENRDERESLSTGKVARLLSVTPDTVLKWIKSGRLPAQRTAGGHYRVARAEVDRLVGGSLPKHDSDGFLYCWEYYAEGGVTGQGCLRCLVYRARARRCYEMSMLPPEAGYEGAYCATSCEECEYYREVVLRPRKVLVVTDSAALRSRLEEDRTRSRLIVEFASGEYECSAVCHEFRPEFVVIDSALPEEARASLCSHLATDPRVPGVQIIFAAPDGPCSTSGMESREGRALPRGFSLSDLEEHIARQEVQPVATA